MSKKMLVFLLVFLFLVFAINFSKAETSYCCEKTVNGAWCQNAPENECANGFRKAATSCESTAYCKLGTCVDTGEGFCQENTPQKVCDNNNGVWYDKSAKELSQCSLGCCLLGEQAAFVTQTRCKSLSSIHGLETNFKMNLNNEMMCIASATSDKKGACVIEKKGERTCRMTTQKECQAMDSKNVEIDRNLIDNLFGNDEAPTSETEISFHEGYLCSADVLATNCGPRGGTTCVEGKDQVYFLDTCGNLANIYDYSKRNSQDYWTYIRGAEESCGYGQSNANSRTCGNCDYYSGSICKSYRETESPAALYGDYVCSDLSCEYKGETYEHGEVWCASNVKEGLEPTVPGGESFRLLCYNGEITVEPCDAWRATVCVETEIEDFKYAVCKANKWQDCVQQKTKEDCLNSQKRDCKWITGSAAYSVLRDDEGVELVVNSESELVEQEKDKDGIPEDNRVGATCVPKNPPGFNFWETQSQASESNRDSEAGNLCNIGTYYCNVKYEYRTISFTGKESIEEKNEKKRKYCIENCHCVPGYEEGDSKHCEKRSCGDYDHEEFLASLQGICGSMGDCGVSVNYVGSQGDYDKYEIDFSQVE